MLDLPRAWWGIELPGHREAPEDYVTYWTFPPEELPPIERDLDDELAWLRAQPPVPDSLATSEVDAVRHATAAELQRLLGDDPAPLPHAFTAFVADPEPRTRVRSTTACYLDLADSTVAVPDGGRLVHFLSDQQWVLHWLLYTDREGGEAVVVTDTPYGYGVPEAPRTFDPPPGTAAICADSFSEFLYRFWIENEIWFALADPDGPRRPLTAEEARYAAHYTTRA